MALILSSSGTDSSFRLILSLVMQCAMLVMLSLPPTASRTSAAMRSLSVISCLPDQSVTRYSICSGFWRRRLPPAPEDSCIQKCPPSHTRAAGHTESVRPSLGNASWSEVQCVAPNAWERIGLSEAGCRAPRGERSEFCRERWVLGTFCRRALKDAVHMEDQIDPFLFVERLRKAASEIVCHGVAAG
jgi:hypothetical protein